MLLTPDARKLTGLIIPFTICVVSSVWCTPTPPTGPNHFVDEPDDAMIRRMVPTVHGPDCAADGPSLPAGVVVASRSRWLAGPRLLRIETTVTNRGDTAVSWPLVTALDWTYRPPGFAGDAFFRRLTYRHDIWYGSTYWTGPNWTRVGKDWHHPGESTPSARCFRVPRDGRITIRGRVYKLDTKSGDGVRLSIRHGAHVVWRAEIAFDDTVGVEPELTLDVRAGESIRFVVDKRGAITCDTTHWDPVIVYADGSRLVASDGFSTREQGDAGWSYEMELDARAEDGYPEVHAFGAGGDLRRRTPEPRRAVVLTEADALPLVVLADGEDQSGLFVVPRGDAAWRCHAERTAAGVLRLVIRTGQTGDGVVIPPGASRPGPGLLVGAYRGRWIEGLTAVQRLLDGNPTDAALGDLRRRLATSFRTLDGSSPARDPESSLGSARSIPEIDLRAMIQAEWRREEHLSDASVSVASATATHIAKARSLLDDRRGGDPGRCAEEAALLDRLSTRLASRALTSTEKAHLYLRARWLKRRIALADPRMQFGPLLFCKRVPTSYSHLVMQYYGWRARPGGGLFVLARPGHSLQTRDILAGQLPEGNVLEPRLSYDAKRIVFSYVPCTGARLDPAVLTADARTDEAYYHIYEIAVDGSGLRQLTRGPYDDLMPTYLPDGGIVFCSTRRRGYARCFGGQFSRRWHVYTLHRMDGDGGDIRPLSRHDTNEWFPTVANDGLVYYSRWDYIDRDAVTHQNLWATRPDGTNPVAVWGNATPSPHCTFQIQPIPDSRKVVCTASAHHSITAGSIIVIDPDAGNDGPAAITRITPEVPFPEAETRAIREYYAAPWPLSETTFLVAYSPTPLVWEPGANARDALGIYLIDRFGNRELIYRDPAIGSTNPCPLVPRRAPPVVPSALPSDPPATGEMLLADVTEGLGDVSPGLIKALRIVQIFPKTTHVVNTPPVGLAGEENTRAVLGTVPVEPDGSARFTVPALTPVLFQALDADGFAYQTMRSLTYLQPGEAVSCVGCHERRVLAPGSADVMAARRPPSRIDPGAFGGQPFSYVRVVQPVLDAHCVRCHDGRSEDGDKKAIIDLTGAPFKGFSRSYWSLCGDRSFTGTGTNPRNAAEALVPRFGARNPIQVTPPGGRYGARGSRLIRLLREGHHDVELPAEDLRRLALWIDTNATFYGVNLPGDQARQLRGEVVAMPDVQ